MNITEQDMLERYPLLIRAVDDTLAGAREELVEELDPLNRLITEELPELARQNSPNGYHDIQRSLEQELERFHEFCEFPNLSNKAVVGIGGAFSAGKSTLVNTLLGTRWLPVEVTTTTALPSYLLHGGRQRIIALNLFGRRLELSQEEFLSLTHNELKRYGCRVARLLRSAFLQLPTFPWPNLALLDTPGYSRAETSAREQRTDANIALASLNAVQYLIWVVSAKDGTITESDLRFLQQIHPDTPRLVLVSRADQLPPDDLDLVVGKIRQTLEERGLSARAVLPVSSRRKHQHLLQPVHEILHDWGQSPRTPLFARNFRQQLDRFRRHLDQARGDAQKRLNRINRILIQADSVELKTDAEDLHRIARTDLERTKHHQQELRDLRNALFSGLSQIGRRVGIPMPTPEEIELDDLGRPDLVPLLQQARTSRNIPAPEPHQAFKPLTAPGPVRNRPQLTRGYIKPTQDRPSPLQPLMQSQPVRDPLTLLVRHHEPRIERLLSSI
jgi:GTP-binding protein EngB required for normal cell division